MQPLPRSEVHRPYGIAIIDAVVLAGLEVMTFDVGPGQDRTLRLGLADTLDGHELVIGWRASTGWTWETLDPFQHPPSEPIGHGSFDLPPLAEPGAVAAAVRDLLGLQPVHLESSWAPPDYHPQTSSPHDNADTDKEEFESALASYSTHPAWLEETATYH